MIVTDAFAVTGVVVIANVALANPTATVTLEGSWATEVLLLCKATTAPPAGAAAVKVTVPVELTLPTTVAGLLVTEDKLTATALMLRIAVLLAPNVA